MEDTILKSGTMVKNNKGEDFEIQTEINISQKEDILKFIGDTPWNEVKLVGCADRQKIDTELDAYECIEDLIQCCELNPPDWLIMKIEYRELDINL